MLVSLRLGLGLGLYDDAVSLLGGVVAQLVAVQVRDLAKVCLSVTVNGGAFGVLCRNLGVWSVRKELWGGDKRNCPHFLWHLYKPSGRPFAICSPRRQ